MCSCGQCGLLLGSGLGRRPHRLCSGLGHLGWEFQKPGQAGSAKEGRWAHLGPVETIRDWSWGPHASRGWALNCGDSGQGPLALEVRVGSLKCVSPPSLASSAQGYQKHSSPPHPALPTLLAQLRAPVCSALLCSAGSAAEGTLSKHLNMSFSCTSALHLLPAHSLRISQRGKRERRKGTLAFIEINCESLQG